MSGKQPSEKPYKCEICLKRFQFRIGLQTHHGRIHKDAPRKKINRSDPESEVVKSSPESKVPPPPKSNPPKIPKKNPPHRQGIRRPGIMRKAGATYQTRLKWGEEYNKLKKGSKKKWREKHGIYFSNT